MEGYERFCPACAGEIENGEAVVFFEGEMYHLDCAPGANDTPPPRPREPRY
jgi:hypothetical protein